MRPLLILILAVAIAAAQNPRPGGGSGGGGGAQGPTGPTGPTGPSGLSLPTAQPVTSGVTTSVTVPYNTTLTDLSQAVPSCTNGSGVGNAAWTTATGNSTQMVISFSGTTTANFTGSCTAILSIGATGPTGPTGPTGGGGISGLTTGTIPKAASATTLNDSAITQSGSNISVVGNGFFNGVAGGGGTVALSNAVLPSIYFGSASGTQGATNYSYGDGIMNTLSGELSFRISNSSKVFMGANGVRAGATQSIGTKFAASGCSNGTTVGGATAGRFVSGTTGACTVTITMGDSITSANGWHCTATNRTTLANLYTQSGDSTTTTTLTGTTVTGDVISFSCVGY